MNARITPIALTAPRYGIGGLALLAGVALCGCQTNTADNSSVTSPAPPLTKVDAKSLPPEAQKAASAAQVQSDAYTKRNAEQAAQMQADMQKAEAAKHK